jgi:hypothetical protein
MVKFDCRKEKQNLRVPASKAFLSGKDMKNLETSPHDGLFKKAYPLQTGSIRGRLSVSGFRVQAPKPSATPLLPFRTTLGFRHNTPRKPLELTGLAIAPYFFNPKRNGGQQ